MFAACIALAALSAGTVAINLGTYVKADYVEVIAGESAKAEALFWTSSEEVYPVELVVLRAPKGWHVVAVPQIFNVGDESEYNQKENILLPGAGAPVAARVANIVISVPEGEKEGTYDVALEAVAGGGSGEISLAQARVFSFKVFVKNPENRAAEKSRISNSGGLDETEDAGLPGIAAENTDGQKAKSFGKTEVRMALLLLLSAAILYGAWTIYRRR